MPNIVEAKLYDSVARKKAMDDICFAYPFIKKRVIGKSCAGREIAAYQIGAGESCLFAAAFHGSEHITAVVLMMFLEEIARAVAEDKTVHGVPVRKGFRQKSAVFVPCVNPDGCEIAVCGAVACGEKRNRIGRLCSNDFAHWNANLRGVDINHNFSAGWRELHRLERNAGIYGPRPTRYGGESPESEPETRALTELCRKQSFRHVTALHAQGEVLYYRYGNHTPNRAKRMAELLSTASGYALEEPEGLAVGGGFKDWFIETFRRPGFTVELGKGENPLPPESASDIYEKAREMLMLCALI